MVIWFDLLCQYGNTVTPRISPPRGLLFLILLDRGSFEGGLFEGAYQIIVDIKKTLIKTSSILVGISL